MAETRPLTFLCLASHFKGMAFVQAAKEAGCRIIIVAKEADKDEAWAREYIDEICKLPLDAKVKEDMLGGTAARLLNL